jgi:hypothetical protein
MRFKQFLTEVQETPRKTIIHFEKMKPSEFLQLCKKIKKNKKLDSVKVSLKVDGASARFGKDNDGEFFFETGKSGLIKTPKAFSEYTMTKGGSDQQVCRAIHYDNMFDELKASNIWKEFPKGTKVICEMLYNPMSEVIGDKLKYVSIHYDADKVGKLMTIVPINIVGNYTVEKLIEQSTKDIKIVSPNLGTLSIDLDINLDVIDTIDEDILNSLRHRDRELKAEYLTILLELKDTIAKLILDYPIIGKEKLGSDFEGLVVELEGKTFKITTKAFKEQKKMDKLNRIKEDIVSPLPNFEKEHIPTFESTSGKWIGTMSQEKIYLSNFFSDYQTFVIFDNNQEAISFVCIDDRIDKSINGQERNKIVRTWTKPELRRKGYLTIIFRFLIDKLNLKLVSDTHLTQDSIDMYKNLIEKKKFLMTTFYNKHTKKFVHCEDEIPNDLWTFPNNWRICLEDSENQYVWHNRIDGLKKPEPGYGVLIEYKLIVDGCV